MGERIPHRARLGVPEPGQKDHGYKSSSPDWQRILVDVVQRSLTADLLKPQWRKVAKITGNRLSGHCYAASEALYHLLGGSGAGWVPHILTHGLWPEGLDVGQTHWFLKNLRTGEVLDPTEGQFEGARVRYDAAKGIGFLTAQPSRRAVTIIERVRVALHTRLAEATSPVSEPPLDERRNDVPTAFSR